MILKNLTPHSITIFNDRDNHFITIQPEGEPPRLETIRTDLCEMSASGYTVLHPGPDTHNFTFPLRRAVLGAPVGLPDHTDGVVLIVSALVAEHPELADRIDLAYPGEPIRDAGGRIVGCRGLCAGPGMAKHIEQSQEPCPACDYYGGYCGGSGHPSCGTFRDLKPGAAIHAGTHLSQN